MIGLPCSGKSTYALELTQKYNAVIHSSDNLREELFGDVNEQSRNDELFQELHKRIKQDLKDGKNVIYDACNISYKRRMVFLQEIKKINCTKECYLMATPYEECIKRNKQRDRKIPQEVIKRMYKNIYIPQLYEGWNNINIIWSFNPEEFTIFDLFNGENGLNHIDQENRHHTLTIGIHCLKCAAVCEELSDNHNLFMAGFFHDIGKRETKEFKNAKGEATTEAHYYGHQFVSAYNAMFYLKAQEYSDENILEICNYIQWHMQPFFLKTEKAKKRLIDLVGQEFYDNLMILHEADKMANR